MDEKIRCIDCVHCWDEPKWLSCCELKITYFCDAGAVEVEIDPEIEHKCSRYEPFIEDI